MITFNQLLTYKRKKKKKYNISSALKKSPQKKGVCVRVGFMKPKKPNSAIRKIAKVKLSNEKSVLCYIPGQGHKLQKYSVVLVRGGRVPDLPGIHYHLIRGPFDFVTFETIFRSKKRSKYGLKSLKKDREKEKLDTN